MKLGVLLALALVSCSEPRMTRLTFECSTDAECAETPPCALKAGCDGSPASTPYRLVGYDCEGALGPLYRDEEDEFPRCGEIVQTWTQ